ncbi:ABC transporter substrate-binding protein [Castellaniella sp. WN]
MKTGWNRRQVLSALGAAGIVCANHASHGLAMAATGSKRPLTDVVFAFTDPGYSPASMYLSSIPIRMGFYRDEGLNVIMQPVKDGAAGAQAVANGQALISIAGAGGFYPYMEIAGNLRVVAFYSDGIYRIQVADESPIKTMADLKGKVIGVQSLGSGSYQFDRILVQKAGLDPDKDVSWLPVGVGNQAAAAYQSGAIQAIGLWDAANVLAFNMIEVEKVRTLDSPMNGLPGMSPVIVSSDTIEKSPELVVGMLRAFWKSIVWAGANPEAAVALHWKQFPEQQPPAADREKRAALAKRLLETRLALAQPHGGLYGNATPEEIQRAADLLHEAGTLKKPFNTERYVDLSFAQKANDFSIEETKKLAPPR